MDAELANARDNAETLAERPKIKVANTDLISLNFKVPLRFRLQLKLYATKRNMTMTELLVQLFEDRLRADDTKNNALQNKEIKK